MRITFTNDYHNTAATVEMPLSGVIPRRTMDRARRQLCNIPDCTCGRIRGKQFAPDGQEIELEETPDGTRISFLPRD